MSIHYGTHFLTNSFFSFAHLLEFWITGKMSTYSHPWGDGWWDSYNSHWYVHVSISYI